MNEPTYFDWSVTPVPERGTAGTTPTAWRFRALWRRESGPLRTRLRFVEVQRRADGSLERREGTRYTEARTPWRAVPQAERTVALAFARAALDQLHLNHLTALAAAVDGDA
ncbi:hypothetical protein [Paraburkholderia mimosarum]|uniref:hypothetical protein n=1 Tax=Paraburkholderia mimosarum TaxID=312026 RepID=UPI00048700F3|nr:hypothetical protein [Paraburkholderia mimosarum]